MHEYHIYGVILFIKSTVNDIPVNRTKAECGVLDKRQIRSVNLVGNQKLGLVQGHVVTARNLLDANAMVVPSACIVELSVEFMDFGGSYEVTLHPGAGKVNHAVRSGPHLKVGALVERTAGSGEPVGLGLGIRINERVAHGELLKGYGADLGRRTLHIHRRALSLLSLWTRTDGAGGRNHASKVPLTGIGRGSLLSTGYVRDDCLGGAFLAFIAGTTAFALA
jgi:hypothetical protein